MSNLKTDPRFKALENFSTIVNPENQIPLLGPPIENQTPESFFSHITNLYKPKCTSKKLAPPSLKGKIIKTATLKRPGEYELRFPGPEGDLKLRFLFTKNKSIPYKWLLANVPRKLLCDIKSLNNFLTIKKFNVKNPCLDESELIID